jgi:hypothetical protein
MSTSTAHLDVPLHDRLQEPPDHPKLARAGREPQPSLTLPSPVNNPEDLQHKTFAVILLGLGIVEVHRARGILKSAWAAWAFPVLAAFGFVLLLLHEHHTGMHGAEHMSAMASIQSEHLSFAGTGFGIGAFRGLSEVPARWQVMFARLWPLLMIVLGRTSRALPRVAPETA